MKERILIALVIATGVAIASGTVYLRAQDAPTLTTEESLRVELIDVKHKLAQANADARACLGTLAPLAAKADGEQLQQSREALLRIIEGNHPGYTFDGKALVKKPEAAK